VNGVPKNNVSGYTVYFGYNDITHFNVRRRHTMQTNLKIPALAILVNCCLNVFWLSATAGESRSNWATDAYRKNCNSVVCIQGDKIDESSGSSHETGKSYNGMGTGIIIDERGYIITNYHVVDGIRKIQVTSSDKTQYIASLIARDPDSDLAIIKINPRKPLQPITFGRSNDLMPGESCIAIGNPYGYAFSLTDGRISGIDREVDVVEKNLVYRLAIQTNTEINPGNSGGPLINVDGEMIGINSAIRQGAAGIAFAIPVDQVIDIASKLIGELTDQSVSHGLKISQVEIAATESQDSSVNFSKPAMRGKHFMVVVESVESNSPAAVANLQTGDIITRIGKYSIGNKLDFFRALLDVKANDDVAFAVMRNQETLDVAVAIGQAKGERIARGSRVVSPPKSATISPKTGNLSSQTSYDELVWETLGIRYTPLSKEEYRQKFPQFLTEFPYGGIVVKSVREGSPMAQKYVAPGDVIVGIHEWVTTSKNDVSYIATVWSSIKTADNTVKLTLFRNGQQYYTFPALPLK
jgi:serine protease Do